MLAGLVATMLLGGQKLIAPDLPREFRAVWVATVDNIDWPSKPGLPVPEMKKEMVAILDKCVQLHLNAVVFQVRPSADALYKSDLEPWSWYLTGDQGKAPADGFDPLEFTVEEGHKRGLEVHAWCNPYRALHPAQKGPVASNHLSVTHPEVVKQYGTYLWMDPGEKVVQDRSYDVFMDIAKRYDVDGIHIDDYFYPYPIKDKDGKDVDFPDGPSYTKYRAGGGLLAKGDWRRKNVDDFIERVYKGLKREKPNVKFGISPFGIYRPGIPETIRAGIDQYDALYADCLRWYREGWCDYMTPQLYWPISQTAQSYPVLLKWWSEQNAKGRHFWPGNFTGRTDPNGGNWKPQEVVDQIDLTRKDSGATGNVHFSMKAFMKDYNGIDEALLKGPYKSIALVPASPWLGKGTPEAPKVSVQKGDFGPTVVIERPSDEKRIRFYVVQSSTNETYVGSERAIGFRNSKATWFSVRAMDKVGNLSNATVVRVSTPTAYSGKRR